MRIRRTKEIPMSTATATAATAAPATTERSPHAVDSPVGAATRAGVELVAWVAAPWALASWSWAAAVLLLVVLVALPATFNVPGDKRHAGHPVSGRVRIGIELLLTGAAVLGAWVAWPTWAGVAVTVLAAAFLGLGLRR